MQINNQKILIIGSGGREHAIGWKLAQSPRNPVLYFAPGNAGTAQIGTNVDIKATDIEGLLTFVKNEKIDVTLAIPDDPLALGIVDLFRENNLRIFGPTKAAAQLEWSKAFSKKFMESHHLPTAKFATFTDFESAISYVKENFRENTVPIVIKASGLALGKGVVIAQTVEEAENVLKEMLVEDKYGEAGKEVVIEEFMTGPEIAMHAFSDGITYEAFPSAQDHKKIGEGDTGPNTGGMGTIAPVPFVDESLFLQMQNSTIVSTLVGMEHDGAPFEGVLYPGLMLTRMESGGLTPKILEYNARFGDPETQSYMRLLDTDLLDIVDACIDKKLNDLEIKWKEIFACNIVLASGGYPGNYEKGKVISGLEHFSRPAKGEWPEAEGVVIFHAGTKIENGNLVTNGGRVLGVSAVGSTLPEALAKAYKAIEKISFEGMYYRKDIGQSALEQK